MTKVLKIRTLQQETVICTISTIKEEHLNYVIIREEEVINTLENRSFFLKQKIVSLRVLLQIKKIYV